MGICALTKYLKPQLCNSVISTNLKVMDHAASTQVLNDCAYQRSYMYKLPILTVRHNPMDALRTCHFSYV